MLNLITLAYLKKLLLESVLASTPTSCENFLAKRYLGTDVVSQEVRELSDKTSSYSMSAASNSKYPTFDPFYH